MNSIINGIRSGFPLQLVPNYTHITKAGVRYTCGVGNREVIID